MSRKEYRRAAQLISNSSQTPTAHGMMISYRSSRPSLRKTTPGLIRNAFALRVGRLHDDPTFSG